MRTLVLYQIIAHIPDDSGGTWPSQYVFEDRASALALKERLKSNHIHLRVDLNLVIPCGLTVEEAVDDVADSLVA